MHTPKRKIHALMLPVLLALVFFSVLVILPGHQPGTAAPAAGRDNGPSAAPDAAEPQKPKPVHLSKHVTEYHIGVRLDEKKDLLTGRQTVTWKHPGTKPVQELYFHLYPNAFRSPETTFMKESGGRLRDSRMHTGRFGGMTVTAIRSLEGEDLTHRMSHVQPDDGNPEDRTLMKLRLPEPVAAGESVTLQLDFEVRLPHLFARMGVAGDFVMAGQWYPKLAVYETAGTRGRDEEGWSLHQYHGNSEFYGNFGIYNVAIDVPEDRIVAATGFQAKPVVRKEGRKTYQFYADDVHDFAWAASPDFVYAEEPHADRHVPGVKIKLYLDPAHAHLEERYMRVAKLALSRYGEWYGPYPYATLSIVVPPADGHGGGGMEYPTLVTAWAAEDDNPGLELERVVAHEIAHQYWSGMVANNEAEEAWLDEAFATYSEFRLMQAEYGQTVDLKLAAVSLKDPAPLHLDAWKFKDHDQYAANVYTRGKLVLLSIEREIGSAKMRKVLKTYFNRWKFKHPGTEDFRKTLEEVSGESWQTFFDQFIYGKATLDYEITEIRSKKVEKNGRKLNEYTVKVANNGGYLRPVPILFYFEDGTVTDKVWAGDEKEAVYKLISDTRMKWAVIDPDYHLLLENKPYNNFLAAEIDQPWKVRWTVMIGKLLETLLGWAI